VSICIVALFSDLVCAIVNGVYNLQPASTACRYGIDDPEIESRWVQDIPHPSPRPALGPIQPPIQWVQGLSWG
jgi:hypothetical protein